MVGLRDQSASVGFHGETSGSSTLGSEDPRGLTSLSGAARDTYGLRLEPSVIETKHRLRLHDLLLLNSDFQSEILVVCIVFDNHGDLVLAEEVDESVALEGSAHQIVDIRDLFLAEHIPVAKLVGDSKWAILAWVDLKLPFGLVSVLLVGFFRLRGLRLIHLSW